MDATFEQAKAFFLQGVAHAENGRWPEAERAFAASLSLVPGRPSTLTNLGAARLALGRADEAKVLLEEALVQEPGNAEAWRHLATAMAETGHTREALAAITRCVDLQPASAAAWTLRGTLEREMGHRPQAAQSFRQALAHGADRDLVGYYLAGVTQEQPPPSAPREYVEQLFDSYEDGFEQHLTQTLGYRTPTVLTEGLGQPRYGAALDLGCGTGLCGPMLRPRCDRLDGVDLSARMVEHARRRGCYDEVTHADVAEFLEATPQRYDLVLAADVFVYVGALERVFAGAAKVLRPGGEFCFSVEAADEADTVALRMSLRYAHSERYIRSLVGPHGFELRATARHPLRMDQGQPIAGLFAWLTRRGTPA
jgi:predicted TPR repeat methyltransferase